MSARPVEVVSFGCRLNLVEGEAMRRAAMAAGRRDLVIVNSCGVTGEAARQARQTVRRLRREQPDRAIVLTGCAAEMDPARFAAMPEIDAMVPNRAKTRLETWGGGRNGEGRASPLEEGVEDHTRAFLAIQNGCDHACTFCAIPQGRGAARSAPLADVVASARRLTLSGFREIVLTGVDLTSYGADLADAPKLGRLVRAILADVPALERLRLSSVDCVEVDDDLLAAFGDEERLMPHLHLSLQSGADLVLKRMRRRHGREAAVALCAELRRRRSDIVFGADLIAGFPTETEAMAEATRSLVDACGLTYLHVFPFSSRPGTPAARMPQVAPGLARERALRLRELGDAALRRHLRAQVGRTVAVLAERGGFGRAPDFSPVVTGSMPPGDLAALTIAGHDGRRLVPCPPLRSEAPRREGERASVAAGRSQPIARGVSTESAARRQPHPPPSARLPRCAGEDAPAIP